MGLRRELLAVVLLLCLGCGSEGSDASGAAGSPTTDGSATTFSDAGSDAEQREYPAGPYGTAAGDVLADLELDGYLRHDSSGLAYQASFGRVRLSDVRATAPAAHALIHVSGFT